MCCVCSVCAVCVLPCVVWEALSSQILALLSMKSYQPWGVGGGGLGSRGPTQSDKKKTTAVKSGNTND